MAAITPVPTLTLNDGTAMPQIGFGVFQVPTEDAARQVRSAIAQGYRAVDTAMFYHNEAGVGEAVRATDDWIFVTTKLWNADHGYDAALRAFDASMDRLGIEKLDLYLIHWPMPAIGKYVETWRALVRLREDGRVGSIGVSNFTADHLTRIIDDSGIVPATNQIELHPHFQQAALREFHRRHGIATTSWSPLGRSAVLDDATIADIARKHGRSPAQIILRWHVQLGLVAIPKSSSAGRQRENLDLFDFALDERDMAAVAAIDRPDGRIGPDPDTMDMR